MKKNGIEFTMKNNCKNPMKIIMDNIDTSNYEYEIQWCEIYNNSELKEIFKVFYKNIDYIGQLKNMEEYYSVFFEAFLFTKNPVKISKAEDYFLNDDLKIAFYNYDINGFTIFLKDKKLLNKIYNNINKNPNFGNINFLENSNYWG